ncbi:MAG TPA: hypothetical protein EYH30_10435 [Anaerolineales bacterium]|nr:hypothetical protein [Anaerolineales bacterium]
MEERRRILEQIEAGQIGVEEGVRRLEALAEAERRSIIPAPSPRLVRLIWQAVLWAGTVVLVGGALLVAAVYAWGAAAGWLICGWPLFILGVLGVAVGWWLREAHWFSLRVRERSGRRFALALPLPLGPIAWLLRALSPLVPWLRDTGIDEVILAMRAELRRGRPFVVEVDEGEEGEQVEIFLG